MCLISKSSKPLVAEKDIVCYKMLSCFGGKWETPFMNVPVSTDVIRGKAAFVAQGEKNVWSYSVDKSTNYFIDKGYIHTYSEKEAETRCIYDWYFECIIPKGTEYFESFDGFEYASDKIIFKGRTTKFYLWKKKMTQKFISIFKKQ